jgi:ADP-ribosyl-[dinitrogen reductase] hydrolase
MGPTDAATGTLLGLACGDALGRPVEFRTPAWIRRHHDTVDTMLGDGTHGQPPGTVTDDTDLALRLARSLAERGRFDPEDVARRFVAWYEAGPFDVGGMTADAIGLLARGVPPEEAGRRVHESSPEGANAGNGSVMRCAPHALAFADDRGRLEEVSRRSSAITHADPRCTAGCAVLNRTLAGLAADEADPLGRALSATDGVPGELREALSGLGDRDPATLDSSGYVVTTLEAGLYHGLTADTAAAAVVDAVAMGGDADTVGAVAGAVAGARFGADALPARWTDALTVREELTDLATTLATGEFAD